MHSDLMVLLSLAWESLTFSNPAGWGTMCYTYKMTAEVGWVSPSEVFATVMESGTYQAAGQTGLKMTAYNTNATKFSKVQQSVSHTL